MLYISSAVVEYNISLFYDIGSSIEQTANKRLDLQSWTIIM